MNVNLANILFVGSYLMQLGDYTTALEYLVLSNNHQAALQVARQNGQIQLLADILGDQAQPEDYHQIAQYYEQERNLLAAGKFFALAGQHAKVLPLRFNRILTEFFNFNTIFAFPPNFHTIFEF